MNDELCLLVTILYEDSLLRCAVKLKDDGRFGFDERIWDEENRRKLRGLLLPHVRSCGPIVEVEEIFEVQTLSPKQEGK